MIIDRRSFLKLQTNLLVAASSLGQVGCDGNVGHFDSLVVDTFDSDSAQYELGQTVTLTWSYSFDNENVQQRNPDNRIKSQQLSIKRLFLIGIAEQKIGPNQTEVTPALDVTTRSFTLSFNGPIVVQIQASFDAAAAADNSDFRPLCSAMLTLRLRQDLFCQATFFSRLGQRNALYPYLGYAQDTQGNFATTSTVNFTQFVVFHDAGALGQMDLAFQAPQFVADRPFRALSFSAQESEDFRTVSGSAYPPRVFTQPKLGLTNAMLFAGAIVFSGQPLPKGNSDARSAASLADQQGVPIFLAMPMLFGRATGAFTIADIHAGSALDFGRPASGQRPLVLTALSTPGQLELGNLGSIAQDLTLVPSGSGLLHQGQIKGARVVHSVTTLSDDIFDSSVDVSFSWQCQFLPDTQLDQVLQLGT